MFKKRSQKQKTKVRITNEEDYKEALCLRIYNVQDDNSQNSYFFSAQGIYQVLYWVEPDRMFSTSPTVGCALPAWNEKSYIVLGRPGKYRKFLNLEVIKIRSKSDPGTSSGVVVVGRARIPLPGKLDKDRQGRFELLRVEGSQVKPEGAIELCMSLIKTTKRYC